ncbi:MAG TPA: hypothetical protein VFZ65_22790 [Planctomycetota bacterium]|nr:hypothetical protein [Planctomycetota bacterium]
MNSTTVPIEPRLPGGPALAEAQAKFAELRRRVHKGIWIETLGVLGLLLVAFALPSYLTDRNLRLEWIFRCVLLASFLFVVLRVVIRRFWRPLQVSLPDEEMALAVERQAPDVRQALISSLQFDRELQTGARSVESAELKAAVIAGVRARLASIPFARAIDAARVRKYAAGLAAAIAFFGGWAALDGSSLVLWARRNLALSNIDWPRYTSLAFADAAASGVRLPQGDALTVRVEVEGPVPDQVFVDYHFDDGEQGTEPMSRTGEREFTWTVDTVLTNVRLRAEGGDALPVELAVTVVERPRIDDLSVQVTFPAYMEREPELVPATEGELRLPRGALLGIAGRSQKPIDAAFLLFGNDLKVPLERAADGFAFHGDFSPPESGLLVVDVVDRDQLGVGTPPRLLLRVGEDKPPTIDFRLRGIGPSITAHARIPGELKVKDDFGLRQVDASMRAVVDATSDTRPPGSEATPAPEEPFEAALVKLDTPLVRSAQRYETQASVDLRQWNRIDEENSPQNRIRPGMLFSLRFGATDNFGPGEPHVGYGETMTFRIVTRDKLGEELRRRQLEQRQELQRITDEVQAAGVEIGEMVKPSDAGERRPLVEARLKVLARQLQSTGRQVAFVGEGYQRILWEYENNRLWEPNRVRQVEGLIPEPLAALAKDAFPATSRLVEAFKVASTDEAKASAVDGYRDIQRRLQAILKEMEQAENLAALLEELRTVIKIEESAIQDVEKRVREREQDVFGPGKDDKHK